MPVDPRPTINAAKSRTQVEMLYRICLRLTGDMVTTWSLIAVTIQLGFGGFVNSLPSRWWSRATRSLQKSYLYMEF